MKIRLIVSLGVMSSMLLFSGCSKINDIFDNRSGDYKKSDSIAALDVPPDLTSPAYDETFTINRRAVRSQVPANTDIPDSTDIKGDSGLVAPKKSDMSIGGQQVGLQRAPVIGGGLPTGIKVKPVPVAKAVVAPKVKTVVQKATPAAKKPTAAKNTKKKTKPKKFKARKTLLSKTPDGQPVLLVQADYKSTWMQTGVVLQRSGFSIDGKNLKQGLYAAKYNGGSLAKKGSKQIIHIIKTDDGSAMRVLDETGKPLKASKSKKILQKLKKEFSQ